MENIQYANIEVLTRLDKLWANKSPGPDGFLPKPLEEVSDQVVPHLLEIFNESLRTGEVPRKLTGDFFYAMLQDYNRNRAIGILYLDFKRVSDKVLHKKLMLKVRTTGIRGAVLNWIEAWLKDRRQRVVNMT
ncbi:uncharacterized protein LOC143029041 [Oratosquilla oratoria]|uniref:uncharacterized protein LOC143029041 n=1 Tax=Oratosquilla oratoria TaxID=337810 RepID=UPI003F77144C